MRQTVSNHVVRPKNVVAVHKWGLNPPLGGKKTFFPLRLKNIAIINNYNSKKFEEHDIFAHAAKIY